MPKLTVEYADIIGGNNPDAYFIRIFVDGEPVSGIQRLELRQTVGDPFPVLELDQFVRTHAMRKLAEKLRHIPGLKYTPLFVNHQGEFVPENDAWFCEDHPLVPAVTGSWQKFEESEEPEKKEP